MLLNSAGEETSRKTVTADVGDEAAAATRGLFDLHVRAEFVDRDLDETMRTMTDAPCVNHVPVMTGGHGWDAVRASYGAHFIGKWPADMQITQVSRTVGQGRVVDELIMSFTHDITMDAILPGVPPTGRTVELPVVVVCGTEGGKVAFERIYWDQATALVQIGLLDPSGLPVTGSEQARKLLEPTLSSNRSWGLKRRRAEGRAALATALARAVSP